MNIVLAQVALANIPKAAWLKQQTFLKIPTDMSGERLLPGLQMAFLLFSWYPHMGESREMRGAGTLMSSDKGTKHIYEDSLFLNQLPLHRLYLIISY